MPAADQHDPIAALRVADFRLFWSAALASNTGSWMQNTAIPFVVFQLTGSSATVGVTGFFLYAPMMVMGIVGGSLADRFPRRALLAITQVLQAVFAFALWVVLATGNATTLNISALGFGAGLAAGLNIPVWQSFVSQLVPRETLANAVTLNSTQFNAARALGPVLAAPIMTTFGASWAFFLNALSFVAILVVLPFITARDPERNINRDVHPLRDLARGARYVLSVPGILACCLAIIAVASLGSPLFSFLPSTYGQEVFDADGWALGLMVGAGGIGALIAAPLLLTRGLRLPRSVLLASAMASYGVSVVIVGLSPFLWVAVIGGLLFGGSYLAIASAINTTIQLLAKEEMRGKAIAFYIACLTGSLPIGIFVWGQSAEQWGIRITTVVAGCLLVIVSILFWVTGRFTAMGAADDAHDAAIRSAGIG